MKKYLIFAIIAFCIDQITKWTALANEQLFRPVKNTGLTFGFFQGANTVMIVVSLIALVLVARLFFKAKKEEYFGFALLLAGISGNLVDRLIHQGVVDFIRVGTFPIFNVADSCIVSGIIFLILLEVPAFNAWVRKTLP